MKKIKHHKHRLDVTAFPFDILQQRSVLKELFLIKKMNGLEVARALSDLIDKLIVTLMKQDRQKRTTSQNHKKHKNFCIVATGGYGRRQLAFFSDIDILILYENRISSYLRTFLHFCLNHLWDKGFKVGHSVHTARSAVKLAQEDLSVRTALLDSRFLCGDRKIYRNFYKLYRSEVMASGGQNFVEERLAARDQRHVKMGDSRYLVEPNLKEGKGGLRDLQSLFWISRFLYGVRDLKGLARRKILRPREVKIFGRAESFLWDVRQQLHLMFDRAEERLTFDVQVALAKTLHYKNRKNTSAAERFMKHYFWHVKNIGDLTRIFCAFLELQHQKKKSQKDRKNSYLKRLEGFYLEGKRLTFKSLKQFNKDPKNIFRIFSTANRYGYDIHPDALRYIAQSIHLIDTKLKNDPEVNAIFLEVLIAPGDPEKNLRRMNEAGVLGRLIPDFGRVVAQTQHDLYHSYTVDEHTIRAIGLLSKIERGELKDLPALASALAGPVRSRPVLYLALFLHDIAKGRGVDHSEAGEIIAYKLAPRIGFTPAETELTAWLVRNHLLMSKTAFKRDLSDIKTISDFTKKVGSLERLQLLTLLTIPDIMAVGPNIWNEWKHRLLSDLFVLAKAWLAKSGESNPMADRVSERKVALTQKFSNIPKEKLDQLIARLPEGFWISGTMEAQAEDVKLLLESVQSGQEIKMGLNADLVPGFARLVMLAPSHPQLLHRLSGALAHHEINIVEARAFLLKGDSMLVSFVVSSEKKEIFILRDGKSSLAETLTEAARGEMRHIRIGTSSPLLRSTNTIFSVAPRLMIDNEISSSHTVLEVRTRDRVGLLYDLTGIIARHGCDLFAAHIATYGARAADVFYIQDRKKRKITNSKILSTLKQEVEQLLNKNERQATDHVSVVAA